MNTQQLIFKSTPEQLEYWKQYRIKNRDLIHKKDRLRWEIRKVKELNKRKDYRLRNKDKTKLYMQNYNLVNREKLKIANAINYLKNKDNIRKRNDKYALEHKEELKESAKLWRKNNKDRMNKRILAYVMNKRKTNMSFLIKMRLRTMLREKIKLYTKKGKLFSANKYGIDYNKIIESLKPFPENIKDYHIDHIRPLCSFDLTNPEQVKEAFEPSNLRWLTKLENLKKVSKDIKLSIHKGHSK